MSEVLQSKRCFRCGETKPLSEFYRHPEMKDGHINKCKQCTRDDVNENRKKRSGYYAAYDRVRGKSEHRREQQKERAKRTMTTEAYTKRDAKSMEKYPERWAARVRLNNAVRDRRIGREPCFICGKEDVEGHHYDYSRPLSVSWLCTAHHAEIHREYDAAADEELLKTAKKGNRWDAYK